MAQTAASPSAPPRPLTAPTPLFSPIPWALGSFAVAVFLAMGEVARLVAMIPDKTGYTIQLTGPLGGPSTLLTWSLAPWELLARIAEDPTAQTFVRVHVALDLVFIALYAVALPRLKHRSPLWESVLGATPPAWAPWISVPRLLYAAAAFDVVEDLGILTVGRAVAVPTPLLVVFSAASKLKWLAVFSFVAWAVVTVRRSDVAKVALRAWAGGLYRQRFSLMAIAPIALLSLVPAGDVLDQLPDVQRRWFTAAAAGQAVEWRDIWQLVIAVGAILVEAVALFVLGRLVGEYTARAVSTQVTRQARLAPWLYGPILVALGAVIFPAHLRPVALAIFIGVPLAVITGSALARRLKWSAATNAPKAVTSQGYAATVVAGDVIAVGVLAVGALALVRSATAVVIVAATEDTINAPGAWIALLLGVVGALAVWPVGHRLLAAISTRAHATAPASTNRIGTTVTAVTRDLTPGLQSTPAGPPTESTQAPGELATFGTRFAWAFILLGTVGLVSLASVPGFATCLGVVGTAMACLLSLSLLIGATVALHHKWGAPEIFRVGPLKAREAPIATLLILALAFAGIGGGGDLHRVRAVEPGVAATQAARPTLEQAFNSWVSRTQSCTVSLTIPATAGSTAGPPVTIRPLLLMAAEGGGARAAYWTASIIDRLEQAPTAPTAGGRSPCGAEQVFLATGVSGGSVGLTVARFRATSHQAKAGVVAMSDPDALSVGSLGLFARDTLSTMTGISWGTREGAWLDRAALMEQAWERHEATLTRPFLDPPDATTRAGFAAALVLGSATAATGCRVVVSQLELRPGADPAAPSSCADARAPAPMTIDLLDAYGPGRPASGPGSEDPDQRCLTTLMASTAAMLSARFPYVTPSGHVGPCQAPDGSSRAAEQLVDGGYVDSTGLGVLVDLAPDLMALIRKHNAALTSVPIVPYVIYADNGTGSDLGAAPPSSIPEVAVPPVGLLSGRGTQSAGHALLQRLDTAIDPLYAGLPATATPDQWRAAAAPITVVYQPTRPVIAAPLGWVLSAASTATMDQALTDSASCPTQVTALAGRGYGSLHTALKVLGEDTCRM